MRYDRLTRAKLAEHYRVTAPAMRRALLDKGLVDPETDRPTRAGHVVGGAFFMERSIDGVPQRWPVWPVERIDALLPDLAAARTAPARVFKDRFKAMDALQDAGQRICSCFAQSRIAADRDLHWLSWMPGHGSLMSMTDASERKRWNRDFLVPLRGRVGELVKRSRAKGRSEAMEGLSIIDGVIAWLSGTKPSAIDVGDPVAKTPMSGFRSEPHPLGHAVSMPSHDMEALLAGWTFEDGGMTEDEERAHSSIMGPLYEAFSERVDGMSSHERIGLARIDDGTVHLIAMHDRTDESDWFGTAWPVLIEEGRIVIRHETSMTVRLPIAGDVFCGRLTIADLEGAAELADRAFALVPGGR